MSLPNSGNPISFSQIRSEFGDGTNTATSPVRLGQYRRDDSDFTKPPSTSSHHNDPLDTGIPTSGEINVAAFYSKKLNVIVDYHTSAVTGGSRPTDARSKYTGSASGNWSVIGGYKDRDASNSSGTKVKINVNKSIGNDTSTTSDASDLGRCALRTGSAWETGTELYVTVGASGKISGAGGAGGTGGWKVGGAATGGNDGNSALGIQYGTDDNETVVEVADGGLISCGYGGGGGGGGCETGSDEENEESGWGGGGGGGAGIPAGAAGLGGNGQTDENGNVGTTPDGSTETGGEGAVGGSDEDKPGGTGGDGGDQNDSAGGGAASTALGDEGGGTITSSALGAGGASGSAIRKTDANIKWNLTSGSAARVKGSTTDTGIT